MDIGEPLLLGVIEGLVRDLPIAPPFAQVRREVAERHPEFGASLLDAWGLPPDAVLVARHHHDARWLATADAVGAGIPRAPPRSAACASSPLPGTP